MITKKIKAINKRVSSVWKECEMFSLYLALIKTKCGSERWLERRDRVSFGNISALHAFAFCVLMWWESHEYPIKQDSKP